MVIKITSINLNLNWNPGYTLLNFTTYDLPVT